MQAESNGGWATAPGCAVTRATTAIALIVAAIASLAITSLVHSLRATAQPGIARPAPPILTAPLSVPLDTGELGPFAFGHLEFDWDPAGDVPGFSSWPPGWHSR